MEDRGRNVRHVAVRAVWLSESQVLERERPLYGAFFVSWGDCVNFCVVGRRGTLQTITVVPASIGDVRHFRRQNQRVTVIVRQSNRAGNGIRNATVGGPIPSSGNHLPLTRPWVWGFLWGPLSVVRPQFIGPNVQRQRPAGCKFYPATGPPHLDGVDARKGECYAPNLST